MALLLWARFAFLAAVAALVAGYMWAGRGEHEE
jgi:hypothetical protein